MDNESYRFSNVIVAEDENDMAEIYEEFLEDKSEKIHFVKNGVSLLNKVTQLLSDGEKVDLILLDENMPFKSGVDALEKIQKFGKNFSSIKVLVISGNNTRLGPGQPSKNPNICYLAKPFSFEHLEKCLNCKAMRLEDFCSERSVD